MNKYSESPLPNFQYEADDGFPAHSPWMFLMFTNSSSSVSAIPGSNYPIFSHFVVPVILWLTALVGSVGNGLVVYVVTRNKEMRSPTNTLIANLAVADLLYVIVFVFLNAYNHQVGGYVFGDIWCRISQYLTLVSVCVSIYTIVLMSLVRYLAVVHPLTSVPIRTTRNSYLAIMILWVTILVSYAYVVHITGQEIRGKTSACILMEKKWFYNTGFQIFFFSTAFVVPLAVLTCLYLLLLRRLWRGAAFQVSAERKKSNKRTTTVVVVVVVVFVICWFPIQIVVFLKSLKVYQPTYLVHKSCHLLSHVNSCINPILYAFLSVNFRQAFRSAVACRSRCCRASSSEGHELTREGSVRNYTNE